MNVNTCRFKFILTIVFLTLLTSCDQGCEVYVTSVAKIDNRTGAAQQLKVCARLAPSAVTIQVEPNQFGQKTITNYTQLKIKNGGPANVCDPIERSAGVFLTTESFNKVKFCHNTETSADIVIVDIGLTCPGGYVEQTAPVDNCN